jgi:hypothetical protein
MMTASKGSPERGQSRMSPSTSDTRSRTHDSVASRAAALPIMEDLLIAIADVADYVNAFYNRERQ